VGVGGEALPKARGDEDGEGREENGEHGDRAVADGVCAAQVPCGAEEDDGEGATRER
jgi:hypothetical protein